MKNKGYTLLELLGVIVILSVLVTLVFPSVINFIKKSNDKIDSITNELIINAAEDYINDNSSNIYLTSGTDYCITIDRLIEYQYLESIRELDNYTRYSKSVKVTYDNGYKYEIIDTDNCFACKLVKDSDENDSLSIGDKYQCKVKDDMEEGFEDGYYFYVLGTNNDGTINLIMERNIYYDETNDVGMVATNNGEVAWYSTEVNNSYGPVTAMYYLHNATKDWSNIPNMVMNYEDENIDSSTQKKGATGYGSIKTTENITIISSKTDEQTGRIENLKARMPRYDEVGGEGKCTTTSGKCPLWLSNYLTSEMFGYWTLSSRGDCSYSAWHVNSLGSINYYNVNNDYSYGVRPVITVSNGVILN
jgi:prepilin-type N-terminal cleavage/methylation domain-containing protein